MTRTSHPGGAHSRPASARYPSSVALGLMAGLLAMVTSLPILVPLSARLTAAYELDAQTAVWIAAAEGARRIDTNSPPLDLAERGVVESVILTGPDEAPDGLGDAPCLAPPQNLPYAGTVRPVSCVTTVTTNQRYWVVGAPSAGGTWGLSLLSVALATVVGLSTALGVLQLLSPLGRIPEGLKNLMQEGPDLEVPPTGLREVDELIDQINATARAMRDREEAIHARITVVQEIARVVAHEIRNPLQSMELLTELMSEEEEPQERLELASSLRHEIGVLERVVTRLLSSRSEDALVLSRALVDLRSLMDRVIALRRPEAKRNGIELSRAPDLPPLVLDGDAVLLSRALENVVANALAIVPHDTGRVYLHGRLEHDRLILLVDDNGPGIPEDIRDTAFERGVTRREGGTGIGLAVVQSFTQAHGGYAEILTSPWGGARVRLVLPTGAEPLTREVSDADSGGG